MNTRTALPAAGSPVALYLAVATVHPVNIRRTLAIAPVYETPTSISESMERKGEHTMYIVLRGNR